MIAVFALALMAPAGAAGIGCIESAIGPAAMARIGDGVVAAAQSGQDFGTAFDADRDAVLAAREACRRQNGWSPDVVLAAMSWTQARATMIGAEKAVRADGLDPDRLRASYAALALPDRRGMIAETTPAGLAAIRSASPRKRARLHVMLYFAGLAGVEFYPADFAAG